MTAARAIESAMAAANPGADTLRLAPLNVPLHVAFPSEAGEAMAAACSGWEGERSAQPAALRLRIDRSQAMSGTGPPAIEADGARLTLHGPGAAGCAEVATGTAWCTVSPDYLANPHALRHEVLEPLVLTLLTRRDRTPLHAAAFLVDGLAILLAGRTGAGKSCLARAADAAGYQVLSEDTVYVQLTPRLTVWGWPGAVHLLARDAPDPAGPTRLRGGRVKHVVPLRSGSPTAIASNDAVLCVLSRSPGDKPALSRISANAARARLWPLDAGFDLLPGPISSAVARLVAGGAWQLRLSADPAEAVRLLAASVPRLRGAAVSARE